MRRISGMYLLVLISIFSVLMLAACGGEDDSTDGDEDGDSEEAVDGDESADGDEIADGDKQNGCGTADMLEGSWASTEITLDIESDLSYHAVGINDTAYDVNGNMTIDGCAASLVETDGMLACPEEQIGQYEFVVTDTTLIFTLVSDACAGRAMGVNGKTFTRQ